MKKLFSLLATSVLTGFMALADDSRPAPQGLYDSAAQALDEGIPDVAIQKLAAYLSAPGLTPEQRLAAVAKLSEAQLAAGRPGEALGTLQANGVGNNETDLVKAGLWPQRVTGRRRVCFLPGSRDRFAPAELRRWSARRNR